MARDELRDALWWSVVRFDFEGARHACTPAQRRSEEAQDWIEIEWDTARAERDKIAIDLSDPETRATFESAEQARDEVASWPAWKRGEIARPPSSRLDAFGSELTDPVRRARDA